MRKYAAATILAAQLDGTARLPKQAHRHTFEYTARPGYLYVRSRAISSRCNDNFDEFPAEEIKAAYKTFVGKPVFVNHENSDHRRARGVVIDAALHEDRNPDGTPDTWCEVLMEVDARRFPKLAKAILDGDVDRTSMGCDVAYSVCSACGNRATTPAEYCQHIPRSKGQRIYRHTASGQRVGELIREVCFGLGFFENSLLVEPPADPTAHFLGVDASGLGKAAGLQAEAAAPQFQNPADHPFYKKVPLHHSHIVDHWNQATDEEKTQGARWYPDAHHVAKAIAKLNPDITDDAEAAHKGAGVLSAYSPQQNWWANMHNAARSFVEQRALGKGEGLMIMGSHANAAQKIMDGEHHQKALKGPKTQDFAHLIEHGGYEPQTDEEKASGTPPAHSHRVVVDRHALSVAAGRRVGSEEGGEFPSGSRHYYEHAAQQYRTAAAQISGSEGRTVAPHEVQATTWLVRQRLNADEDASSPGGKGRQTNMRNQREKWRGLSSEHVPQLKAEDNSHTARQHLAYGETKAPADVDTLREDSCPVCGDSVTYDGEMCRICGFISPPQQFRDPDLDMAKQLDLRKQVVDPSMVDDDGTLTPVGGPDGDGTLDPRDPLADPTGGQAVDPSMIGPDGQVLPSGQALDGTQLNGAPTAVDGNGDGIVQPDEIGLDGEVIPPEAGGQATPRVLPWRAQDHTGDPFTPGPDMPDRPEEPEGPDVLPPEEDRAEAEMAMPGTPGDSVPDLMCPSCGFQAAATLPTSQNMGDPMAAADGTVAGDVCPNCGQAQLLTPAELQGADSVPPPVAMPVRR
ncbi:DUF7178 family protein [Kitasatospora viridis]|uniref:Uncharacterized protein n=1 Tax=Kitasatospora viridis TaxID=281105 RepID=A0A561S9W8_9ACTN|nr:hypothetical protein [Kitasatospora viridis]TWF71666.1 hypothetical protein FHX73_1837 [Kitasatospora viridis]